MAEGAEWYKEYLQTDRWRQLRIKCFERDHYTCQFCWKKMQADNLNAHHMSYANLGNDDYELYDLITLCRDCHQRWHNNTDSSLSDYNIYKSYAKIDLALALPALPACFKAREAEIQWGAQMTHNVLKGCSRDHGVPNKIYSMIKSIIEDKRIDKVDSCMYTLREYLPGLYEGIQKNENIMHKKDQRGEYT